MKQLLLFLSLMSLLLAACGGTPTPDLEATVQVAIAATLTARPTETLTTTLTQTSTPTAMPAPTQTATLTETPEPTDTLTTTPTPAPKLASTNTPTPAPTGDLVQGSVYGIQVVDVKKTDSYVWLEGTFPQTVHPDQDHIFLEVGVRFSQHGTPLWNRQETLELSVIDPSGEVYAIADPEHGEISGSLDESGEFIPSHYVVRFSVPKTITGFELRYRDLPLIDLGL